MYTGTRCINYLTTLLLSILSADESFSLSVLTFLRDELIRLTRAHSLFIEFQVFKFQAHVVSLVIKFPPLVAFLKVFFLNVLTKLKLKSYIKKFLLRSEDGSRTANSNVTNERSSGEFEVFHGVTADKSTCSA